MRRRVRAAEHRTQIALAGPAAGGVPHDCRHVDADHAAVAELGADPIENRGIVAQICADIEQTPAFVERGQTRRVVLRPSQIEPQEAGAICR